MLVNPESKIVATWLRGDKLTEAVEKAVPKPAAPEPPSGVSGQVLDANGKLVAGTGGFVGRYVRLHSRRNPCAQYTEVEVYGRLPQQDHRQAGAGCGRSNNLPISSPSNVTWRPCAQLSSWHGHPARASHTQSDSTEYNG